ncbi:hypothetical protein A2Z00_03300 [Candidatus Gottesmanbacteria bacterium RBG_13_45_10]|uniref:EamA domain-containing protein n=1 Tax=Candidatus Gottesmanbacteria bacterium RBG_13_45_10 TaxID=1798370 RepID=A0A1F5ZI67_9BACT|nr:MAG: hypothetical protein A2Z00_03300 [Candidatus Gottesmanbacteria bacterium RBG_13_45_10]
MIKKGVALSLVTALISGIAIFSNSIFVSHADPLIFTIVRNALVALVLTGILVGMQQLEKLRSLTKKEWGLLVAIGAIGGGIPFAMFFTGLSMIGAVNGNILQKTLFLWIALLAIPILKERISKVQLLGYLALFLGMFVFGGSFRFVPAAGSYLVLGATILWAVENIIAKITLRSVSPAIVSWGRMVFGLPFLLIAVAVFGKMHMLVSPTALAPFPLVASSVLLVAYVLTWYTALSSAPATLVSSILVFAPVVTAILASGILHKGIAGQQLVSMILLTVGTLLVSTVVFKPKNQTLDV